MKYLIHQANKVEITALKIIYMYIYIYPHIHTYIYIYRERERERERGLMVIETKD